MNKFVAVLAFITIFGLYAYSMNNDYQEQERIDIAINQRQQEQSLCRASIIYASKMAYQEGYLTRQAEDMTNIKVSKK